MNKDSIATGLVRPKTTALFFDKIWIPFDLRYSYFGEIMGYSDIPDNVRFIEKREEERLSFGKFSPYNYAYMSVEDSLDFLFSSGRNKSIMQIIKKFKELYNLDIVPIFFEKTKFENMILSADNYSIYEFGEHNFINDVGKVISIDGKDKKRINKRIKNIKENSKTNINAIEVCIKFIPEILDEKLEWKQVMEIKKDKKSIESLKRFWHWFNIDLNNKKNEEVSELLEKELDDYKFSLRKHGILTSIGGFTTILSSASTFLTAMLNGGIQKVSAGFTISTAILTFSSSQIAELFQTRREPIAYIYNLNEMVDKKQ